MRFLVRWKFCAVHFCIVTTAAVVLASIAKILHHTAYWRSLLTVLVHNTPSWVVPLAKAFQAWESLPFDILVAAGVAVIWGQMNIATAYELNRSWGRHRGVKVVVCAVPSISALVLFWGAGGALTLAILFGKTLLTYGLTMGSILAFRAFDKRLPTFQYALRYAAILCGL